MKKLLLSLFIIVLLSFFLLPVDDIKARSGCCSHHGGVCGCRCCDGNPLSAKCAPYYPQCSAKPTLKYELPVPKEKPSAWQYNLPATKKYTAEIPKRNSSNDVSIWWRIIEIGVVGCFCYIFRKRKSS